MGLKLEQPNLYGFPPMGYHMLTERQYIRSHRRWTSRAVLKRAGCINSARQEERWALAHLCRLQYRQLNSASKVDAYPMPQCGELNDCLGWGKNVITNRWETVGPYGWKFSSQDSICNPLWALTAKSHAAWPSLSFTKRSPHDGQAPCVRLQCTKFCKLLVCN